VIWVSEYTLVPRAPLSALAGAEPRRGALIRIGSGFADVHPWPELGDEPLPRQLAMLARGLTTPLTARSLALAKVDADAREAGRSLFEGVIIPQSHWPGSDPPPAFSIAKVKTGAALPDRVRLRIDYNAMLTAEEFLEVAAALPRDRIDFIEDPCPYDGPTWSMLRERTGLRLALDRAFATEGVDVVVVKPAIQDIDMFIEWGSSFIVTSYMDHPVGQLGAAYVAATHEVGVCGLLTHVLFQPNAFSERLRIAGTRLLPPDGSGLGFDDLLESLPWKKLA